LALKARRQFRYESATPAFLANLNALAQIQVETPPHDDTIAYYLERVSPQAFALLPVHLIRRLVRMKALDRWRLHGAFLVAIDGTGQLVFHHRHCPHCLTRTSDSGQRLYFHPVLEAKLVTANGLVFSMATAFIENTDPKATKQDCELKAFQRLAVQLKEHFPQLPLILLGDSLYACNRFFTLCRENQWKFIVTFKKSDMPSLFAEFETLRDLSPKNRVEHRQDGWTQQFAWVNQLPYDKHRLSAFECRQTRRQECGYFAWLTNIEVGTASVITLANQGGRLRWKIENEGFNIQKNHGYELEHAYSENEQAAKNFYYLLQVAHAINQLMIKGSLLPDFVKVMGSLRNYLRRLAECFRQVVIEAQMWDPAAAVAIQIRLDTS